MRESRGWLSDRVGASKIENFTGWTVICLAAPMLWGNWGLSSGFQ